MADDALLPGERTLAEHLSGSPVGSRPLSRRARQTQRSLESYVAAAVLPRYIERLREIADELAVQTFRLERAHRVLRTACGSDDALFERRWRAMAERWRLDHVNELIRQHNEYYPAESGLPLDPRTGDYVQIRGRSYMREPVGADWILERFPPS
jgi:hypothetical protein